jgi:hypothetical protein
MSTENEASKCEGGFLVICFSASLARVQALSVHQRGLRLTLFVKCSFYVVTEMAQQETDDLP